jgi:hypothetical protein
LIAASFSILGWITLSHARSSFGYIVGFYFFTLILGYLWLAPFSRFAYGHNVAMTSAFASGLAFLAAQNVAFPIDRRVVLTDRAVLLLLSAIVMVAAATLIIGSLYSFRLVHLSEIYIFQKEISFPTPIKYAIGTVSTALVPFAFACFIERRQYLSAAFSLVLLISFYPLTLTKTALFAPFWLVFLAVLATYCEIRTATILSLLIPTTLGIASIWSPLTSVFGIVNIRMMAVPSIALDVYNDFFARHPLTHFCQVRLLKPFMECAYSDQMGVIMADVYRAGNFNASMFATEGIASVGNWFAPIVAVLCGLVISLASSAARDLSPRFVFVSSGVLVLAITNVPFTTAMLTHGAVLLFLLWSVMPKNCGALETVPSKLPMPNLYGLSAEGIRIQPVE